MGNDAPKASSPPGKYVTSHQYGGQVLLNENIGTVYQHIVLEEKSVARFMTLLEQRKKLNHQHLLTARSFFTKTQHSPAFSCTYDNKIEVFIEYSYIKRTLEDVIEDYSKRGAQLSESEVCRIFGIVVEVLQYLKQNGTCHGDIKPSNILLDHIGVIKIIDSYFVSGGKTAYQIVMENPSSMSLLSPQQMQCIKDRQFQDIKKIHQSQIFAVGLSMLEAMTFQSAMECYDLNSLTIKADYHKKKLEQLKQSAYSPRLVQLVMACIAQKPEQRPSFDTFIKLLRQ